MSIVDPDDEPPPGVKRWLVSCDESGIDGAPYYGFGTLWMPWQRRGDFQRIFSEARARHGCYHEVKWTRSQERVLAFYKDLIDVFFRTRWLAFHCIVVRLASVDRGKHAGCMDLARRKHFTLLLTDKIKRCLKAHPLDDQTFRIWVDPIASAYAKADEACEVIANHVLARVFNGRRPVDKVLTRDSKTTPAIQMCDLLLGAVIGAWRDNASNAAKLGVRQHIAGHLGWGDLRADTLRGERKFNIWFFHDPTSKADREAISRPVKLKHPLPFRKSSD